MRHSISYGSTKPTPLNFEEICPTWSNKLKADLDQDDLHILIRKPEMCIVGEAWGYTSRYLEYRVVYLIPFIGCWKCIKYGNKIGKIAKQYNELCRSYLQPTIDDFVDHWNEKHQDRCASASNRQMVKEYIIDNYRVYHAMISLV